jgi:4-deoxy-L-threo-5-hexosulose-uronate ketol-isomerase
MSPYETSNLGSSGLKEQYLIDGLFSGQDPKLVYSHHDRMVIGGVAPIDGPVRLETPEELRVEYFLQRRELGVVNIGGAGTIMAGGERFVMQSRQALYVGRGTEEVVFESEDSTDPACFYLVSVPSHADHEIRKIAESDAEAASMGSSERSNERTLRRYIHGGGAQSSQLMLGITTLGPGSVWNTMPPHVHDRRSEVYLYFGLPEGERVLHLMGEPQETRHLVAGNEEAVISPSWSIHAGAGTASYSFVWAMAGENYTFEDMDPAPLEELR